MKVGVCACVCGGGSWGCLDELIKNREKTWKDMGLHVTWKRK